MASEGAYADSVSRQVGAGPKPFFNHKQDANLFSALQSSLSQSPGIIQSQSTSHDRHHDYNNSERAQAHPGGGPGPQSSSTPDQQHASQYPSAFTAGNGHIPGGSNIAEDALRAAQQSQQETQSLAQRMMSMDNHHDDQHALSPDGPLSARAKRNKVSRACDECRRKKIRCDASENDPSIMCSNCRRTGARCGFSRMPMKRGPSKGYIKELADKIDVLENRLGPPAFGSGPSSLDAGYAGQYGQGFDANQNGQDHPPVDINAPSAQISRKRTHSVSSREANGINGSGVAWEGAYGTGRPNASIWDQRQLPPLSSLQHPQTPNRDANMETRQHYPPKSEALRYNGPDRQSVGIGVPHDVEQDNDSSPILEWDESVIDEYYRIIHQTFPLLPHSKMRLRLRLVNCTASLREAFLVALDCCMRSSPHSNLPHTADLQKRTRKAAELIATCQYENSATKTLSTNLIYIQTLILMAFESDNHGPATMRGQVGPPRAEWLGRAIGMATHLKLNLMTKGNKFDAGDVDGDERLGRRAWWILFILDRWHACSTSCLLQLPENSSNLIADDQILLGESTYHLARLSHILGHLNLILNSEPELMSPTNSASPIISTTILGEVSRFRESVESLLLGSPNLVHLCYYHVRLLTHRLTATSQHYDLKEMLLPANRMAGILNSRATSITPLNHHFAALAAQTLVECAEFEERRDAARDGLREIEEAIGGRKGLMARQDSQGWDSAIRVAVEKGLKRIAELDRAGEGTGLQGLADAAMGRGEGTINTNGDGHDARVRSRREWDPTTLTRYGYLAALVKE